MRTRVSPLMGLNFPGRLAGEPRRKFLVGLFYANLLCFQVSPSQKCFNPFGPCTDLALPYVPVGVALAASPRAQRQEVAVVASDPPSLNLYALADGGRIVSTASYSLSRPCHALTGEDLDGDGENEFLGLTSEGDAVLVLKRTVGAIHERLVPLDVRPDQFVVADVDDDGKKDILLFGKSMAGVAVLHLGQNGNFTPGALLFPEISASSLRTADLNGDGITDIFLLNWLSNQLQLFFGISRGFFSEQVTIDLGGEPSDLAITAVTRRRTVRVAVTLPAERRIVVLSGNATGEFNVDATIALPGTPGRIQFAALNNDPFVDLVSSTGKGILSVMAVSATEFATPVTVGLGNPGELWRCADLDGNRTPDVVMVDRPSRRLVLASNGSTRSRIAWAPQYAVGSSPQGLCTTDLDGDGLMDVLVANEGSSTLSVLKNLGDGTFSSEYMVSVAEYPSSIATVPGMVQGRKIVILSHARADKLSVLLLDRGGTRTESILLPSGPQPRVIQAQSTDGVNRLMILVRYAAQRNESVSFALYEQISGHQFLERSFRSNLSNRIRSLTAGDITGEGNFDVVFLNHERLTRETSISVAPGGRAYALTSYRELLSIPDTTNGARIIRCEDLDGDGNDDIVVALGPPACMLTIAYAGRQRSFDIPLVTVQHVNPAGEENFLIQDVDGDGRKDISMGDTLSDSVVVFYRSPSGTFSGRSAICSARGVTAIRAGALREPATVDLILAHGEKGMVSVKYAAFKR